MLRQAVQMLVTIGEPGSTTVMSRDPSVALVDGFKVKESWVDDTPNVLCAPPTCAPETKTFAPL
jgi:hypothetical protein